MRTKESSGAVMMKTRSRCLTNGSMSGSPLDSLAFVGSMCMKPEKSNPAQISRKRSRPREVQRSEESSKVITTRMKCSARRQTRICHENARCSSSLAIISFPKGSKPHEGKGLPYNKHEDFNIKAKSRIVTPIKSKRCPSVSARIQLRRRQNQSGLPITQTKGTNFLYGDLIHPERDKCPESNSFCRKQIHTKPLHSDEESAPSHRSSRHKHETRVERFVHSRVAVKINHSLKFGSFAIYEEGFGLITFDDGEEEVFDDDELFQAINLYQTHKKNHTSEKISIRSDTNALSNTSQSERSTNKSPYRGKRHSISSVACPTFEESMSPIETVKEIKRYGKNRKGCTILPILSQNKSGRDLATKRSTTPTRLDGCSIAHGLTLKSSSSKVRYSSTTKKRRLERVGKSSMGKNKRLRLELASPVKCGKLVIPGRQFPRPKQKSKIGNMSKTSQLLCSKGKELPDAKEKFVGVHPSVSTADYLLVKKSRHIGSEAPALSNASDSKEEGTSEVGINDDNPLDSCRPSCNIHIETCQAMTTQTENMRALSKTNDYCGVNSKKKKTRTDAMLEFIITIEEDLTTLKKQIEMNRDDKNIASVDDVMKVFISLTGKHVFLDHPERAKKPSKPYSTSIISNRVVSKSTYSLRPSDKKETHGTTGFSFKDVPEANTRMRNELAPPPLPLPKSRLSNWEDGGEHNNQFVPSKTPDAFLYSNKEVHYNLEEHNSGLTRDLCHNNRLSTAVVSEHDRLSPKQSRCNVDSDILTTLGGSLSKPPSNSKTQREVVAALGVHALESLKSNHLLSSSITEGNNKNIVVSKDVNAIFRSLLLKDKCSLIRESLETSGISQITSDISEEDDDENSTSVTLLMDLPNYSHD